MSEIQITLKIDRATGKKDILVELTSDADYTHFEHDRKHQQVVEQLIAKGILTADEVGDVRVERIRPTPASPSAAAEQEPPIAEPPGSSST